jgi:hypothetical protein
VAAGARAALRGVLRTVLGPRLLTAVALAALIAAAVLRASLASPSGASPLRP